MLDRLEVKGIVRRAYSTKDRRERILELTPLGLRAARQVPRLVREVDGNMPEGFMPEEIHQLEGYLARMATAQAGRQD